jgi:hypothetical protein
LKDHRRSSAQESPLLFFESSKVHVPGSNSFKPNEQHCLIFDFSDNFVELYILLGCIFDFSDWVFDFSDWVFDFFCKKMMAHQQECTIISCCWVFYGKNI